MKKIALASAAAVILFLPESNRFDLLVVAAVVYAVTAYMVRHLAGTFIRMQDERRWLKNLRWVRRNPPALIDLDEKPEWPLIEQNGDYLLFQWIGGADNASHVG